MREFVLVLGVVGAAGAARAQYNTAHFGFVFVDDAGGSGSIGPQELSVTGGDAGVPGESEWRGVTPVDGTLSYEWEYSSIDTGCFDTGYMDVNSSRTMLACNSTITSFGIVVFNLSKGDTLDFGVWTSDGAFGPGVLKIKGFDFEPVPGPGAAALLALAGLMGPRSRTAERGRGPAGSAAR